MELWFFDCGTKQQGQLSTLLVPAQLVILPVHDVVGCVGEQTGHPQGAAVNESWHVAWLPEAVKMLQQCTQTIESSIRQLDSCVCNGQAL